MPTIILYTSIALALFLVFSITFCVVSCLNCSKRTTSGRKRRQSRTNHVCICLVVLVYLLGIGDMIYVACRINKSTVAIDDTIEYANREIYPKQVSEHLTYIIHQIENVDAYCIQPDSILINASKTMIIKTFNEILRKKYFIEDVSQSLKKVDNSIQTINQLVEQDANISQIAKDIYQNAKDQYNSMIDSLQKPLEEVCRYAAGTQTDIDEKLVQALNLVHRKLVEIINIIRRDILNPITTSDNQMFMNSDIEEQVRQYVKMSGIISLVFVIFLTLIPTGFAILILLSCLCKGNPEESSYEKHDDIRMNHMRRPSETSSKNSHHSQPYSSYYQHDNIEYRNKGPSGVVLCLMRIAFTVMIIMLIIMTILTGAYYTADIALHSACRTVHDDQSFLIPFITNQVIGTTTFFTDDTDLNTTVLNLIDDCHNHVHFTRRLMDNYWPTLDRYLTDMMNELNKQIYDQFINSIYQIDIPDEINLLAQFANKTNISDIANQVNEINTDLNGLNTILGNIGAGGSALPENITQSTIVEFNDYLKQVVESTLDSCPLPFAMIYKTDTLVCHQLGDSINGLWFSVFFSMFVTTVGLCIFGIWIYKRST
ncbi:hypothetical protein I4U23_001751 [Adineta vaga]|nr:hypothetical protein I4U23_001751 [Adineta vaga]